MRINIRHLRSFSELARVGSFTRASENLCVSQPALTSTINQLEEDLDMRLVERTTRQMKLTLEGLEFLEFANRMLMEYEEGLTRLRKGSKRKRDAINIGLAETATTSFGGRALARLVGNHVETDINIRHGTNAEIAKQVENEELHGAICTTARINPELQYEELMKGHYGLLCRYDHILARRQNEVSLSDITNLPEGAVTFIGGCFDDGIWGNKNADLNLPDFITAPPISCANPMELAKLIESGAGVSLIPEHLYKAMGNRHIVFRKLVAPETTSTLFLIRKRRRHYSQTVRTILEEWQALFLEEYEAVGSGPAWSQPPLPLSFAS